MQNKKIFNELIKDRSSEFWNLKKRINPDNLIYKKETEERSLKNFKNYQNPIKLFKDLRDDNVDPNEALKNQIHFKSNLNKIRKRNPILKSEE